MNGTSSIASRWAGCLLSGVAFFALPHVAAATQAYNNPGPFVTPWMNPTGPPGLPSPSKVPGKELSFDGEYSPFGTGGLLDPYPYDFEQVIAWDGFGGVMDGIDYTDAPRPNDPNPRDVDALANFADTLFQETLNDTAHLIFSVSQRVSPPGIDGNSGYLLLPAIEPVSVSNGSVIGSPGELSYELAGNYASPSSQGLWASRAALDENQSSLDLDAVELWGPEPDLDASPQILGDSNRYSILGDQELGVSVWNRKRNPDNSYSSLPYVLHSEVVAAVVDRLGPATGFTEQQLAMKIDLDALMAYDAPGSNTREFDGVDPVSGPWDMILFSIRQIRDGADESDFYATGSEIFWLDASGASGFLHHGGHDWDKTYALEHFVVHGDEYDLVLDIDALEAVAVEVIPEPASALLLAIGALVLLLNRRR